MLRLTKFSQRKRYSYRPSNCRFQVVDKEFQFVGNERVGLVVILQETARRP